jgi:large subunit ribosomal protein L5
MHFLKYFHNKTLKFDLINKFYYTDLKKLPKLKKVVINSSCKTAELKTLATNLLALELITNQRGILTVSKRPNLLLKIRKGDPTGCKLTLKKPSMLNFFSKSLNEVFPKIKNFNGITISKKIEKGSCSFVIKDILHFTELSEHYSLFNGLSKFDLSFVTTVKTQKEMLFFLKSLQLPIVSQ